MAVKGAVRFTSRVLALAVSTLAVQLLASPTQVEDPGPGLVSVGQLPPVVAGPYRVQVGDVLSIDFFTTEELSKTETVGPDGDIYLPLIGRVVALGRTVDDLTAELTRRYSVEMVNPQITVSVAEYSGLLVYVGGEVLEPGLLEYRGGLTLVQAIMEKGGFTRRARMQEVLLIRPGPDNRPVGTLIDVKRILRKGHLSEDVPLAPLDVIHVHHKKIVNVNIFVQQYISDNLPRFGAWAWYLPGYGER
jgi:polysaccharide export outer membrane protein